MMSTFKAEDLPDTAKRRNPGVFAPKTTQEDRQSEYRAGAEVKFQKDAEAYLCFLGFEPRTPKALDRGKPENGWYLHIFRAEKNPLVLDLLVIPHDVPAFELELKAKGGKLRKAQRQIVEQFDRACECRSMQDVKEAVETYWKQEQKQEG